MNKLPANAVQFVQQYIKEAVASAQVLADLTCGNGRDTEFLCRFKPKDSIVYAVDIQPEAIARTQAYLKQQNMWNEQVILLCDSHDRVWERLPETIDLAMMNLGYLPCGDHALHTKADTTIEAVKQSLKRLRPFGVLSICAYPGTPEGEMERDALEIYLRSINQKEVQICCWQPVNQIHKPPVAYILQKR